MRICDSRNGFHQVLRWTLPQELRSSFFPSTTSYSYSFSGANFTIGIGYRLPAHPLRESHILIKTHKGIEIMVPGEFMHRVSMESPSFKT
jgi:hypothetical protein